MVDLIAAHPLLSSSVCGLLKAVSISGLWHRKYSFPDAET
jgi:hypothetical protein